jgi:hypothetical protein
VLSVVRVNTSEAGLSFSTRTSLGVKPLLSTVILVACPATAVTLAAAEPVLAVASDLEQAVAAAKHSPASA